MHRVKGDMCRASAKILKWITQYLSTPCHKLIEEKMMNDLTYATVSVHPSSWLDLGINSTLCYPQEKVLILPARLAATLSKTSLKVFIFFT